MWTHLALEPPGDQAEVAERKSSGNSFGGRVILSQFSARGRNKKDESGAALFL